MTPEFRPPEFPDSDFDLRARAELALAYPADAAPAHLFRKAQPLLARRSFQRAVLGLLLAGSGTGAVLAMRPPELVRGAIEHEYFERTLRGTFMDSAPLLQHLGLGGKQVVPGFPQLMRPCDIDGHLVYHLTTFFEKGGMVTVFAFDKAVALTEGSGWWGNVHWKVITSRDGKPLVLVAQKKQALAVAQSQFGPATDMSPPEFHNDPQGDPMNKTLNSLPRRQMLAGSASALAAAGLATFTRGAAAAGETPVATATPKPLPAYVAWKDPASVIVHSSTTIETKRAAFGSGVITPAEQLYIRNNLPAPDASIVADRDAWEVAIEGVKAPRKLTLRELKTMGVETTAMVLQCSGNGRGYFPSKPSGTPWQVGAAGCVMWTGVPVRVVAEALGGVVPGAAFLTGTGGEKLPEGLDPLSIIVERSVPAAAMADALLAWEMNGVPISLAHGGPLRLIVPGYTGVNNIKYIKRLAFTAKETDAKIMSHGYRISPPGGKGEPSQPSVQEMTVKSWINSPAPDAAGVRAGLVQVQGVAFGGLNGIKRVEVSLDGGKTWSDARLTGPDLGRYAWRQFVLPARLPAGSHTLASRATDTAGNVQPEQRMENAGGYNNTSWADHAVKVTVA